MNGTLPIGIGARPKPQLIAVRRQSDVDGKHPELLQERQHARFGRQRQRDDQHVDAGDAGELDQFRDIAEFRIAGDDRRRALVVAVVEDAADADVVIGLLFDRADQPFRCLAAADDHRAALHAAVARPAADHPCHDEPHGDDHAQPDDEPQAEHDA